jgi:hypothetical protein
LTNHQLGEPGGTEANVRDWAIGLLRRGHRPIAYAPVLGRTAIYMRERSIPVVDDLSLVTEPPDIVHGTHTPTILESIVRFPHVPVIQTCQGVGYPMSEPLLLEQVRRYVAVDETNRDYLVTEGGVPPARVRLVHNAIDLRRIPDRPRPLPARPERALIFTKTQSQVPLIEEACRRMGIALGQSLGRGVGRTIVDPERELADYDLIFATARSAIEAIAAGAATVVVDGRGLAGMVTPENFDHLRMHNFGLRSLTHDVTLDRLIAEIGRYDPSSAMKVTESLRISADIERQLDAFESIYAEALEECASIAFSERELIDRLLPILHKWLPRYPGEVWAWQFEKAELLARIAQLDTSLAGERRESLRQASLQASLASSLAASLRARLRRHPRLHGVLSATVAPIIRRWNGKS